MAWLDAQDPTTLSTIGGAVSEWRDKSGNDYHAVQGTAGNRPAFSTGVVGPLGKPAVVFDGSDDILFFPSSTAVSQFTSFLVWNLLSVDYGTSYYPVLLGDGTNSPGVAMGLEIGAPSGGDADALDVIGVSSNDSRATLANIAGVGYYRSLTWSSTSTHATSVWLDGTAAAMTTTGGDVPWSFTLGSAAQSGPWGSLGGYTSGYANVGIAEFIFYDRVLTTEERQGVESYLEGRWFSASPPPAVPEPAPLTLAFVTAVASAILRRRASQARGDESAGL